MKERQRQEGHCYLCNKQGHLKRDCPKNSQRGSTPTLYLSSAMRLTQMEEADSSENEVVNDKMSQLKKRELIAQMHGMEVKERDKVIDALISQENF
jgi:hypothetical protein